MATLDINNLDTLILDLGGVLIDVDYERTAQAFRLLGVPDFEAQFSKAKQTPLFDRFETGAITPEQFRGEVRTLLGPGLFDAQIDTAWNAMLGSIPMGRMHLVEDLRMRYRVFLLSNTNAIHVPAFRDIIKRENLINDFNAEFDGVYLSCELGLRKPDAAIFERVMKEQFALPERTLFIDDSIQHVQGAERTGMHAEHLDLGKEDLIGLVERLGLLV